MTVICASFDESGGGVCPGGDRRHVGDDRSVQRHDPGSAAALTTILAFPGESLDTLRRILRLTPSGAGRLIDRLAAADLVQRRAGSSDQRFIALHLTPRGRGLAKRVLVARRAALRRPLAALTAQERALLEPILAKMLYAMTPDRERCDHICRLCEISACPQNICPVETAAVVHQPELTHGSNPLNGTARAEDRHEVSHVSPAWIA